MCINLVSVFPSIPLKEDPKETKAPTNLYNKWKLSTSNTFFSVYRLCWHQRQTMLPISLFPLHIFIIKIKIAKSKKASASYLKFYSQVDYYFFEQEN